MTDDLRKAGRDLVITYKAAGLSISDIATVLVFALEAVVRDQDTPQSTLRLLDAMVHRPS